MDAYDALEFGERPRRKRKLQRLPPPPDLSWLNAQQEKMRGLSDDIITLNSAGYTCSAIARATGRCVWVIFSWRAGRSYPRDEGLAAAIKLQADAAGKAIVEYIGARGGKDANKTQTEKKNIGQSSQSGSSN